MKFFNTHCIHLTLPSKGKKIVLVSILVTVLLVLPTATARLKDYRQQWRLSRNREPEWKVQHNATIGTSIMVSDTNKEVVNVFQEHDSEDEGPEIKTHQNNGTNVYWEIVVDNLGGRRNVTGVRRSEVGAEMHKLLPGVNKSDEEKKKKKDKIRTGHVGLVIDVSGDEKEEVRHKKQESTRSTAIREVFEQFYELEHYVTELLDLEGKAMFFFLFKSAFRIKQRIKTSNEQDR
jgi:hypothetical protein